jgi:myosin heavy subunit
MTTLGKILAIVNLVLSLVVGAFIVMSYMARTNWHEAYTRVEQQLKVCKDDASAYQAEVLQAQKTMAQLQADKANMEQAVKAANAAADSRVKTATDQWEAEKRTLLAQTTNASTLQAELERRQAEVKLLTEQVGKRDGDLAKMEKQVQDFRDNAVDKEIFAKSMQEKNERLLAEVERLHKWIKDKESGVGERSAIVKNPPNEDVEGKILQTDESGLVTISIGSDHGVKQGNTLDVFRLSPEPRYLGTIEILRARPNEAVGRMTSKGRVSPAVGDKVASSVMSKRYSEQGASGIR